MLRDKNPFIEEFLTENFHVDEHQAARRLFHEAFLKQLLKRTYVPPTKEEFIEAIQTFNDKYSSLIDFFIEQADEYRLLYTDWLYEERFTFVSDILSPRIVDGVTNRTIFTSGSEEQVKSLIIELIAIYKTDSQYDFNTHQFPKPINEPKTDVILQVNCNEVYQVQSLHGLGKLTLYLVTEVYSGSFKLYEQDFKYYDGITKEFVDSIQNIGLKRNAEILLERKIEYEKSVKEFKTVEKLIEKIKNGVFTTNTCLRVLGYVVDRNVDLRNIETFK